MQTGWTGLARQMGPPCDVRGHFRSFWPRNQRYARSQGFRAGWRWPEASKTFVEGYSWAWQDGRGSSQVLPSLCQASIWEICAALTEVCWHHRASWTTISEQVKSYCDRLYSPQPRIQIDRGWLQDKSYSWIPSNSTKTESFCRRRNHSLRRTWVNLNYFSARSEYKSRNSCTKVTKRIIWSHVKSYQWKIGCTAFSVPC